ncbi:MAG: anaerobic ribonucleoside-triphosphate reductase, partial [Bacteroidaceae bacterium]|nr:anaerobic ribonucleoside-triphosphate reductase [Bacteroidaceae bacterium]
MIQTVVKRDGRIVGFNEEKIATAIRKAMLHTDKGEDMHLIRQITDHVAFRGEAQMTVEAIQDMVELELMKSSRKDVAQKYIAYRNQRRIARKAKTRDIFLEIINIKSNDVTRENANMNADTPAGMMMKFASESTKPFVDDYLLSDEAKEAVRNNYLHIHDKDYYPTKSLTCIQHPLDHILAHGFSAGHGESRPAKRIETASILACISMETAQNEMHGGQAIPAFDFYLAPYVRSSFIEEIKGLEELMGQDYSHLYNKELEDYLIKPLEGLEGEERILQCAINKTVTRVHQAMEAFIHNMNTIHSRGGNQVVFSSINYGTDTSAEGRCIIRELLKSTERGVGGGETAIFPIQIWKKKRGVSYLIEDRNYDLYRLACKVSARRFFPNFLNLDATFNQNDAWQPNDPKRYVHEVATMGCRTRVFENRFGPKTSIGRGNLSFSTINIVRLAIECMEIEDRELRISQFFAKLDNLLEIAARQLHER